MRSVHYRIIKPYKDTPHGPSDRIRTCGILLPKQARYQLRYTRLFSCFIRLGVFSQNQARYQTSLSPDMKLELDAVVVKYVVKEILPHF